MLYYFIKFLSTLVIYFLFFPKIAGRKNVKLKGGGIIICNHISMWDPLFLGIVFHRCIFWMAKDGFFKKKLSRAFFYGVNAFPVRRGETDLRALRHAFRLLRNGKILGIFPEGTRIKSDEMSNFKSGTSMIALRNKVPVIPVYIKGNYKVFKRMKMIVGEPIFLSEHVGEKINITAAANATKILEDKLADMSDMEF